MAVVGKPFAKSIDVLCGCVLQKAWGGVGFIYAGVFQNRALFYVFIFVLTCGGTKSSFNWLAFHPRPCQKKENSWMNSQSNWVSLSTTPIYNPVLGCISSTHLWYNTGIFSQVKQLDGVKMAFHTCAKLYRIHDFSCPGPPIFKCFTSFK